MDIVVAVVEVEVALKKAQTMIGLKLKILPAKPIRQTKKTKNVKEKRMKTMTSNLTTSKNQTLNYGAAKNGLMTMTK
jgi:hypothetical protein